MIVDSSAIVAILAQEPEARDFAEAIASAPVRRLSAASYLETAIVVDGRRSRLATERLDNFIARAGIEIAPVTASQARLARAAYRDYGKGSKHPAKLNFGDCFAYALAKETGEPLLFKGTDFGKTDVETA